MFVQSSFSLLKEMEIPRSDPAVTEVTDILSVNIYNSLTTR